MHVPQVVGPPLLLAPLGPPAQPARVDRPGHRLDRVRVEGEEAAPQLLQVRHGVLVGPGELLTGAEPDDQPRRRAALQPLEHRAVVRHLHQRVGRGLAGQLGVAHLVGVVAERARHAVHPDEEVGVPEPRLVEAAPPGRRRRHRRAARPPWHGRPLPTRDGRGVAGSPRRRTPKRAACRAWRARARRRGRSRAPGNQRPTRSPRRAPSTERRARRPTRRRSARARRAGRRARSRAR